jgi:3-oxoacyl-[acyl-carrier-protein] synthase II
MAWEHAGLNGVGGVDCEMVGVYLGGGEGPIDFDNFVLAAITGWNPENRELDAVRWAEVAYERLDAVREFEQDPNCAAGHIAYRFNAQGPNFNTLTACAASTQAIGEATCLIRRGDADIMISGGAHSMIHPLGVTGFNRLTALSTRNESPQTASRPFDRLRDGFVLGEGSGILILEEYENARRRGAEIHGEIVGYGSTADAFRVTDMHEEGRGPAAAMRAALDDASIKPADVDYISAHGTSTEENDKIESLAISKVFGQHAAKVPVSSVKSMLGHLIAGAGSVELITCLLAMRDGIIPPTTNYEYPDPNCDLDYVPNQPRQANLRICLSNSFGFGGQNNTIIVRKPA